MHRRYVSIVTALSLSKEVTRMKLRPFELKILNENRDCTWRVFNHNHTLLGVFPSKKLADEEAKYYSSVTGNAAYVMHEEMA
jgi:hypothetical protein